ncbi:MAG TPA: class I SAM-dependent methyltransferase [Pirellulales bacterium]|jgi:SAM-dependent methyltransferase|nr:class I SAM-dependent methyltransferase [Pirellulales bacterium]
MTAADGFYRSDLSFIHDAGFGHFARHAADFVIDQLRAVGKPSGLIVDLGCGSGILAERVTKAGYQVLGFDLSPAMVELARKRAPSGTFHSASFLQAQFPACVAVTAVGEVFNYLFDSANTLVRLRRFFQRVHRALEPGGLFVFDVALVGRVPGGIRQGHSEGADWACLYEAREDAQRKQLERRITTFRKSGNDYRREQETHRLRLYEKAELAGELREAGFRVRTLGRYGKLEFPAGYAGFRARKR